VYTVNFKDVVTPPETNHHIIFKPDPRQCPVDHHHLQVPEGGSGWAFILVAFAAIAWAATVRHFDKRASQHAT